MTSAGCCPAPCHKENALTWLQCSHIDHISTALNFLNELAQEEKGKLVEQILKHRNPKLCIDALQKLLKSPDLRLASTAACIFGILLETESMVSEIQKWTDEDTSPIRALDRILTKNDPDLVMNATRVIASLVETAIGRQWLLQSQTVFNQVLESVTIHLENERENTVNSAALILAQLSLCEEACQKILSHPSVSKTFRCLAKCLSCSHKDTAMNAAVAVGRLCGNGQAKNLILREAKDQQLVYRLQALLSSGTGPEMCQIVCFALSCLANDDDGHALLMESSSVSALLDALLQLLQSAEPDTVWFAAMTLRVLLSRPSGVVLVRMHGALHEQLQMLSKLSTNGPELQDEVKMCLNKLECLFKPSSVTVTDLSSSAYTVSWERCEPESGLEVTYSLFDRDVMLYRGQLCQVTLPISTNQSLDSLSLRLSLSTSDGDVSPFSDPVDITVEPLETSLRCPPELCVIGCTSTHVRLCWSEPEGGVKPKSYEIYCNDTLVKTTTLLKTVVSGLSPGTHYELSVRSLRPGHTASPRSVTEVKTADDQDHAPTALTVLVVGRHELQINWRAPAAPMGRLFKYELGLNGCVAYVGTERAYTARRLSANTAYTCIVTAVTSKGRCHSRPVTKKTARDEYLPSNRYLQTSYSSGSSPASQKTSEVAKMTAKSTTTQKHKPNIYSNRGQHAHKQRRVSVQIRIPKENKSFNHISKIDRLTAGMFPVSSSGLQSSPRESENKQIQTESSDPQKNTNMRSKTSQVEDVRLLRPVSFNLSDLQRTEEQIRAQIGRNKTISKVRNQKKGEHTPTHTSCRMTSGQFV